MVWWNIMKTGDVLLCGGIFEHAKHIAMHVVPRKHFIWAFASDLEENLEELFPRY